MAHISFASQPVSIGPDFAFYLSNDSVWCSGNDSCGALGLGNIIHTNGKAQLVETLRDKKITFVECGQGHTILLDYEGGVWGCGWNECGQLGLGQPKLGEGIYQPKIPEKIPGLPKIAVAQAGGTHTLFLD